jgi:hypothetical protein
LRQREAECGEFEREYRVVAEGGRHLEELHDEQVGGKVNDDGAQEAERAIEHGAEPECLREFPSVVRRMAFSQVLDGAGAEIHVEHREITDYRADQRDDSITFDAQRRDQERDGGERGDRRQRRSRHIPE